MGLQEKSRQEEGQNKANGQYIVVDENLAKLRKLIADTGSYGQADEKPLFEQC